MRQVLKIHQNLGIFHASRYKLDVSAGAMCVGEVFKLVFFFFSLRN